MKSVLMLWFFIVLIFITLGLGFAYLIQQQQATSQGVQSMEQKVAGFDVSVKKLESQLKTDSESIKTIQGTIVSGEAEKKGLSEKVSALAAGIEEMKSQLNDIMKAKEASSVAVQAPAAVPAPVITPAPAASSAVPVPDASVPPVDLGSIPVAKEGR